MHRGDLALSLFIFTSCANLFVHSLGEYSKKATREDFKLDGAISFGILCTSCCCCASDRKEKVTTRVQPVYMLHERSHCIILEIVLLAFLGKGIAI